MWSMNFDDQVSISAPAEHVWAVYADVERWPAWTASVTEVRFVSGTEIAVGTKVRIRQPKLPTTVWEVTEVQPGTGWTWVARAPGATTEAWHRISAQPDGAVRVAQGIRQTGPLGWVVSRVYAGLTRRYLAMEGAGLKERCEASVPRA
jgi:uncharacterized membrane protein